MRVLVLTSSTGGGHDTRARAFAAWARRETDVGLEVVIHQALEETHGLYRFGVGLYNWIQRKVPRLHHLYFNFLEAGGLLKSPARLLGAERFRAVVRAHRPGAVLSVHGSLNHGFFAVARDTLPDAPPRCATYCGELFGGYGFSRHWVNPRADLFVGAVEECATEARRLGMAADRTCVGGFLLDPSFYAAPLTEPERRAILREKFALDPDRFTLLLTTGAVGANNHLALLEALARSPLRPQVIAVCGRAPQVRQAVTEWSAAHAGLPVRPIEFTDRMAELLRCVSAVVARPGTGTTSEAILSGCPVIFNGLGGVMPQEMITVKFATAHGFSRRLRRASDLPEVLKPLMADRNNLLALREKISAARPAGSPRGILELVAGGSGRKDSDRA